MKRKATGTRAKGARGAAAATLVYDGSCGSCAWFARTVHLLDSQNKIALATFEDPATHKRLARELGAKYTLSFHLVDEGTGAVRSGEDALLALARLLPSVRPLAEAVFALPGVRRLPGVLYRTAAAWRRCTVGAAPSRTGKVT